MECPICQESFNLEERGMRMLPCLHVACASCLSDILNEAARTRRQAICVSCSEIFSAELVVMPLPSARKLTSCYLHGNKDESLYCTECSMFVCTECVTTTHQGHTCTALQTAADRICEVLKSTLPKLAERIPQLQAVHQGLRLHSSNLKLRWSLLIRDVRQTFNRMLEDLTQEVAELTKENSAITQEAGLQAQQTFDNLAHRCQELIELAEIQLKADLKLIELQCTAVETFQDHVSLAVKNAEKMLSYQELPPASVLFVANNIYKRMLHLQNIQPITEPAVKETLRFYISRPTKLMTAAVDQLGRITQPRNYTSIFQPSSEFGTKAFAPGGFWMPVGIAQLHNSDLVIADCYNTRLQVFSLTGVLVRKFAVPAKPYHIAISTTTTDIWVTAYEVDLVLRYNNQGVLLSAISVIEPYGIALGENGSVVVSCGRKNCVKMFDDDGIECWTSFGHTLGFAGGVAVTPNGEVMVCDDHNNCLNVLSASDGKFLRAICVGRVRSPQSVAVIPHAHQIVVTSFGHVSIWTFEGALVHQWTTQSCHLQGVTVTTDGQIAVVNSTTSSVQIF